MKIELSMILTLKDRFNWLKNNKPSTYKEQLGCTWEENVEVNIKRDMYSFAFNHPYYCGDSGMTDDKARHQLLDDINVPRILPTSKIYKLKEGGK